MDRNDPRSIHSLFQEAFNAGDIDSLVSLYEPNAVLVVSGQPVVGHTSIRAAYKVFLARGSRMTLKTRSVVSFQRNACALAR